ncbi:MAG: RNA-directed DNA polymerase [Cyanobacteria bacterium P01_G01_bin.39]
MVTIESLLERGYFPKEIVPAFNTRNLSTILDDFDFSNHQPKTSKCLIHSLPKTKDIRRNLSIPNPKHQILLSKAIADNWIKIYSFTSQSRISKSSISVELDNPYNRAAYPGNNFNIKLERAIQASGFSHCLYSDISRYYSTIYTHSIPWAIHTKQLAKANYSDNLYGNLLDKCIRNTQDGQTLGIPIGTDTSYIISEVIGSAIDSLLYDNLGDKLQGFRYIDDYYLYFGSRSEAESTSRKLHHILKEFELEPNASKMLIMDLPEPIEDEWYSDLHSFNIGRYSRNQRDELLIYFSKTFQHYKNFSSQSIIKYAVSKIKKLSVFKENWELYQSLLLQSLVADSGIISIIYEIFSLYRTRGLQLNINKIHSSINKFLVYQAELSHGYEVSWALWLCKNFEIQISEEAINKVLNVEDSIVGIIAFDLIKNSSLISSNVNLDRWERLMDSSELYSRNWLFAYEANFQGWSSSMPDYVASDDFFSILKSNNVNFYNPGEDNSPSSEGEFFMGY